MASGRLQTVPRHYLRCESVEIDSAIVIRNVDLAAVNHRRVKFVKEKLDAPALRVPENLERSVSRKMHRIVDEQATVHDPSVGIAVRNRANENRRIWIRAIT